MRNVIKPKQLNIPEQCTETSTVTMPKTVVCTFATKEFYGSADVLRHTALDVGGADRVTVFTEKDVEPWFAEHPDLRSTKGYGWWSWKPYVILECLRDTQPGDVVVYCDAGIEFVASLEPYVEAVKDITLFRLGEHESIDYRNKNWTKPHALRECPESADVPQLTAAIQVYRHTPATVRFLEEWRALCSRADLIDDTLTETPPGYQAHRWDQSLLTMVAVRWGVPCFRDPSQYGKNDTNTPAVSPDPLINHHRLRLNPVKIAVITPTIGGRFLRRCVRSVQHQTLPNVDHYVVVDGPEHEDRVRQLLSEFQGRKPVKVMVLPENVGANGWNGHKIYGAMPWLVDPRTDFVAFLDDDNEYDPDHLRLLARHVVGAQAAWGYSLRRIVDEDGEDVCPDNCESLGGLCHAVTGPKDRLIDTSCYLINKDLAIAASRHWNYPFRSGPEPDRELSKWLLSNAPHVCVRSHTVKYRAGNTARSVTADFFKKGNEVMGYDFAGKPDLYIFHFWPEATSTFLASRRKTDRSYALDEWHMTLLRGLDSDFNLLDGYACMPLIPPGATVFVSMCMPDHVPWKFLESRPDLWRIGYTNESPNIRHAQQWDPILLRKHFDILLTYWAPLLRDPRVNTIKCPQNAHHLDFDNPLDLLNLKANAGQGKSCAMVLECRPLSGTYEVPNMPVTLTCLDHLRERIVADLDDVTVFGVGWDRACARNPGIKLGHALHRSVDDRSSVDILSGYSFAIIVENCDAEGYVSEKLYDALMAGCVPLYYGNSFFDIPEGVDGLYLDLRKFFGEKVDSAVLRDFLRSLTDDQVEAWKRRVVEHRETVLRLVDTRAVADLVKQAVEARPI